MISASGGDIKTHGFIHEGTKNSKVKDPVEEALLESMLHSNTQGARALRATMGVEFDQKPSKSAFGAVALRKIGFDPFTGQQHLAPPSTKKVLEDLDAVRPKAAKVAKKEEPDMIELELDDDDD